MTFPRFGFRGAVVWAALFCCSLGASQTYWFSDAPPTEEIAKKMRSSHGGPVQTGKRGMYLKRLWLREGEDPVNAAYVKHSEMPLVLMNPDKEIKEKAFMNRGYADVMYPMSVEGFYNLFMIGKTVDNGMLEVSVVKHEMLNHSCREGHDHVKAKMQPNYYDEAPLDIIRERFEKETFHTRLSSGDVVSFQILRRGKPLKGASVTLVTQKGWAKTLKTDAGGRVSFAMIRDYYPQWHEFQRRHRETFLVIAEFESADAGVHEGQSYERTRYKATAQGSYYPSTKDYKSYLYGLLLGIFALFASGVIIYVYRRRRQKAYKELRLD